MLSLYWVKI